MMVFALTTSVKSNTTIIIAADTTADDNKLYMQAEILPAFPGGSDKFSGFLQENIRYPDAMSKAIVTGKVNVQSIVEKDGSLSDIQHPAADREAKVTVRVIVSFVVERDGSITNVKGISGSRIVNGISGLSGTVTIMKEAIMLGNEAIRVMRTMPKWNPGYQNNRAVRVLYVAQVDFPMNEDEVQPIAKTPVSSLPLSPPASSITAPPIVDVIYSSVDQAPQFPGGMDAFGKFLGQNVRYPVAMHEKLLEGIVTAQFVVEPDGSLSNIKVLRGPGYGSSEEAVRVLGLSPKWKPGLNKGKPVRVADTVLIHFTLKKADQPVTHGVIVDKTDSIRLGKIIDIKGYTIDNLPLLVIDGVIRDKDSF